MVQGMADDEKVSNGVSECVRERAIECVGNTSLLEDERSFVEGNGHGPDGYMSEYLLACRQDLQLER